MMAMNTRHFFASLSVFIFQQSSPIPVVATRNHERKTVATGYGGDLGLQLFAAEVRATSCDFH